MLLACLDEELRLERRGENEKETRNCVDSARERLSKQKCGSRTLPSPYCLYGFSMAILDSCKSAVRQFTRSKDWRKRGGKLANLPAVVDPSKPDRPNNLFILRALYHEKDGIEVACLTFRLCRFSHRRKEVRWWSDRPTEGVRSTQKGGSREELRQRNEENARQGFHLLWRKEVPILCNEDWGEGRSQGRELRRRREPKGRTFESDLLNGCQIVVPLSLDDLEGAQHLSRLVLAWEGRRRSLSERQGLDSRAESPCC